MTAEDVAGVGTSTIPATDSQAAAVKALADFGTTVVEHGGLLARSVGRILGTAPEDAAGLVLGEPLHFARQIIAGELDLLLNKIQQRRGYKPQPVSPSLAIPLIRAAYDESRPELQQIWAELIAAAMDPARSDRVRLRFIETVKQFDPLDALLLQRLPTVPGELEPFAAQYWASKLSKGLDAVFVSVTNLIRLECVTQVPANRKQLPLTPYGRELLRACED